MGLNSKLVTERGLDAVGDQVKSRELKVSLGADSQLVQAVKGGVQQMDYLYQFPEGQKIEAWLEDAFRDLGIRSDRLNHEGGRRGGLTNGNVPSASLGILLQNAIEHGSHFGELGPVELRGLFGKAVFLTIDDPGAGFDFSKLDRWFQWRRSNQISVAQRERIARGHKPGKRGGVGIEYVNEIANVDVWFERLADKFRTNLLFKRTSNYRVNPVKIRGEQVLDWGLNRGCGV